jgi:hypothetical protein
VVTRRVLAESRSGSRGMSLYGDVFACSLGTLDGRLFYLRNVRREALLLLGDVRQEAFCGHWKLDCWWSIIWRTVQTRWLNNYI